MLEPLVLVVDPDGRQLFNDTDDDQLWLVAAPPGGGQHLEMSEEEIAWMYPDGPEGAYRPSWAAKAGT